MVTYRHRGDTYRTVCTLHLRIPGIRVNFITGVRSVDGFASGLTSANIPQSLYDPQTQLLRTRLIGKTCLTIGFRIFAEEKRFKALL